MTTHKMVLRSEGKMASHGLQAALWALESRKANREARGVEGASKA